jgi:hypothetical protein
MGLLMFREETDYESGGMPWRGLLQKFKWQTYGQAETVGNMCKGPDKYIVAAAGATRKAKAASTFTVIKKLRTEDRGC